MFTAFKLYLLTLKLSPISRKLYLSDVRRFLTWLRNITPNMPNEPTLDLLSSPSSYSHYLHLLRDEAMAPSMLKRTLASLKQFGTFLSLTYNIVNPMINSTLPDSLTSRSADSLTLWNYIKHFINYLNGEHLSPLTIRSYKSDITRYIDWASTNLPSATMAQLLIDSNIQIYLKYLTESGNSLPSTIERKAKSITRLQVWYSKVYGNIHIPDNNAELSHTRYEGLPHTGYVIPTNNPIQAPDQPKLSVKNKDSRKRLISLFPYLVSPKVRNFAALFVLLIFAATLGIFGYRQFTRDASLTSAFPSTPITPNRQLSFQGRLENAAGTPISSATDMTFKLYDSAGTGHPPSGGTQLYTTGVCSITPDADGVFSTQIGGTCGSAIASTVFTENANVWLEVTVVSDVLDPRQQIASVAYALNSETLQGFPISSTVSAIRNTVVPMNQWGEIIIGEQSPRMRGVSGTFAISAPSLTLSTTTGSNGNITISPDGTGQLNVNGNTTSTNFFNVSNAQLTTGSLITGIVGNANTGFKLIDLLSGVSPTSKFSVSDAGSITFAGALQPGGLAGSAGNILISNGAGASPTWTTLGATSITADSLDFTEFKDAMTLDASTDIALGAFTLSTSGTGAISFNNSGAFTVASTTWTATPTISGLITATSGLTANGTLTSNAATVLGDNITDTVTVNAGAWTFANDTTVALTGGVNGLNFDSNTLSIDATNDRVGIGTSTPSSKLEVNGATETTTLLDNDASNFFDGGCTASQTVTGIDSSGAITCTSITGVAASSMPWSGLTAPTANLTLAHGAFTTAFTFNSVTTATAFDMSSTSLTSGKLLNLASTSTALTTGNLLALDWSPGSATTATGDLFSLNIGANGTTSNLFNIKDTGSSLFSVSETLFTSNLPTSFTSAGDVSMAYDLIFTNPTLSNIKSAAPLTITAGETFNSSDLTLQTYNAGDVIADTGTTGTFKATGTTTFNNLVYTWPSSHTANGVLQNNGSGTLTWATLGAASITADSLDYTEFQDTMDFDADLITNQGAFTNTYNFTGTTTTGLTYNADSVSTGIGVLVSADGLTTGSALSLTSTSTAGGASGLSKVLNIARSGANTNASHTAYGVYSSITNTGTTSTNVAGYFSASGATNNYAGIFANGNVGIGDTDPLALLTVGASDAFQVNSSGAIAAATGITSSGTINFSGLTASRAVFTDASSNLAITGTSAMLLNSLTDETGTGVAVFGTAPTFTTSIITPLVIGSTTANGTLTLEGNNTTGNTATNANLIFKVGDSAATTAMTILNNSNVGIGVTGPVEKLEVNGNIVAGSFIDSSGSGAFYVNPANATSISIEGDIISNGLFSISSNGTNGNITINAGTGTVEIGSGGAGKLDAGTIDPPYTINGSKFATFVAGMTGVKEETTGNIIASEYVSGIGYRATLDLANSPEGSDIWLFTKSTGLKTKLDKMVVLLSSSGNTKTWYDIEPESGKLYLYALSPTTISYRLTAPRYDAMNWLNTRDADSISTGHIINENDPWSVSSTIADIINAGKAQINTLLGNVETNLISPQDPSHSITVAAPVVITPVSSDSPALVVSGEIDATSISARTAKLNDIQAETITARNIIADTISANHIEGLDAKIASLSAGLSDTEITTITDRIKARLDTLTGNIATATDLPTPELATPSSIIASVGDLPSTASDSAVLAMLDADFVTINNYLAVIGTATITTLDVTNGLYTNTINSKDSLLALQPMGGIINLAGNTLIVDSTGEVLINGNLTVSGKILAESASINTLELGTPNASSSALGKLLSVYNEHGVAVATIDASGSANFTDLSTRLITIASASDSTPSSSLLTSSSTSNATAGESVLVSPDTELTISSPYVTKDTLVYLTPTTNTDNKVLFVKAKESCTAEPSNCTPSFTVAIDTPASTDISFNWWIIQLKQ